MIQLRSLYLPLLCLTCFFIPLSALADKACTSDKYDETATIRHIYDGDTLRLDDGRKIRLIGINTPELGKKDKPAEPYAIKAKNALKAIVKESKSITLRYGKDKKDRYGRFLAHVFLADGQNIQATLLNQGLARVITVPPNTQFTSCYLDVERQARCNKTGLWHNTDILEANKLEEHHVGFHLVQGKVKNISTNNKGIWLNIDNKLTIGIRPDNQPLFNIDTINKLSNQTIMVRGWINKQANKTNKSTLYYMRIRHPLSIQLASEFSCR